MQLRPASLIADNKYATDRAPSNADILLTVLATLGRAGKEVRLIVGPSTSLPTSTAPDGRDPALIKLVVKAHAARAAIMAAPEETIDDIAQAQGHDRDYFGVLLRLSWLAPNITQSILEGRQPAGMTRQSLARMAGPSFLWDAGGPGY